MAPERAFVAAEPLEYAIGVMNETGETICQLAIDGVPLSRRVDAIPRQRLYGRPSTSRRHQRNNIRPELHSFVVSWKHRGSSASARLVCLRLVLLVDVGGRRCLHPKQAGLDRGGAPEPPEEAGELEHQLALDGGLSIKIRGDGQLERLVVLGVFETVQDGFGGQAVTERIQSRASFAVLDRGPVLWRALRRLASICLNDVMGSCTFGGLHLASGTWVRRAHLNLRALCRFLSGGGCFWGSAMCVLPQRMSLSHSARATLIGSIPAFCHHFASSPL